MSRLKALAVGVLALAALAGGTATAGAANTGATTTGTHGVQVVRTVCADTVDVRWTPGGSPTGRLVYWGQTVNVVDYRDGVWWQINSPYSGYVLAQYFC
ncbi:SH3 domain-containing protein [Saccharothrix yanglingensis]|uniref:SH3 domain-containing protein n=1 Tax=Saccharothrix yanglingensis TaxID=659496 RepID=A0ABU0X2N1_9PSEU|nr:SH3 domain-containing protein [Saccharothrix yanglingensis]MDQ2585872.1 hypothetical protein [Saccharothrix yanglingensis]